MGGYLDDPRETLCSCLTPPLLWPLNPCPHRLYPVNHEVRRTEHSLWPSGDGTGLWMCSTWAWGILWAETMGGTSEVLDWQENHCQPSAGLCGWVWAGV